MEIEDGPIEPAKLSVHDHGADMVHGPGIRGNGHPELAEATVALPSRARWSSSAEQRGDREGGDAGGW